MIQTEHRQRPSGSALATVLAVEDEPLLLDSLSQAFEDFGYSVLRASDGSEAYRLLADTPVDLLVTDVRLPGPLEGWDVAEEARRRYPKVKVIYVTGYTGGTPRDVPDSVFIVKPYRPSLVIRAARRLGAV